MNAPVTFELGQFDQLPVEGGIYAWYYKPHISKKAIKDLEDEHHELDSAELSIRIKALLYREVFEFLDEADYQATMDGGLRPDYVGKLKYVSPVSKSLCDALAKRPEQLWTIQSILKNCPFYFTPPIYVGMSKSLRTRLKTHRTHLEGMSFQDEEHSAALLKDVRDEDERRSMSFALDVSRRDMSLERLCVAVNVMNVEDDSHKNIENILNRIAHPICGRN